MPVPTSITDLSTTAASNYPTGAEAIFPNLDDHLRAAYAFIAQNYADKLPKAGGTMTGPLTLNADASSALHAVPKQQLDAGLAAKAAASHSHDWSAITNKGMAEGGSDDPNTTTHNIIVTDHANTPDSGSYWAIQTIFHSVPSTSTSRAQLATRFGADPQVFARSWVSGSWQSWFRLDTSEANYNSLGSTGFARMIGGLIVQWGTAGSGTVTFPVTFPNSAYQVLLMPVITGADVHGNYLHIASLTASGFTRTDATLACRWIALGA